MKDLIQNVTYNKPFARITTLTKVIINDDLDHHMHFSYLSGFWQLG